ncbi:T9SS type A sorting domain-containing protein [uncultured Prevotellamassilia sp.]|uniref:T9SS type A sorting domain-containing protein n=1 Tax=uncultured Prevotellamassilia sp. TaxID=1926676 RepID=UPI00259692E5|nr:T9SS type A sorting domain-containing protein [uncultured Prevotellamassilia sp.]
MKKTLLVVSALSVALASQAQILKPESVLGDMRVPVPVPGMFTCDGKSRMSNYLDHGEKKVKVYNENLDVEKEFDLVLPNAQSYAVTKSRELLWKNMPQSDRVVDYVVNPIAIEKVTADLIRDEMTELNEYYEPRKMFGKEAVITETSRTATAVSFEISVNKDSLEVSKDYNGKLTGHYYIGQITYSLVDSLTLSGDRQQCGKYSGTLKYYGPSLTGAWKEDPEESNKYSFEIRPLNLYYYDMTSSYDDGSFLITQNLFNTDKAYEYVVPICQLVVERTTETDRDGDGEPDQIVTWYGRTYPGFKIMQDNGNVLATIMLDEGYSLNTYESDFTFVHFENKNYIVANVQKAGSDGETEFASIFYAITPGDAASIKAVRTERTGLKATPEFARKNEMVVVDFSTIENAKLLSVVNGNGQTVMQVPVANGQTSYRLNTSNLPAGLYVVKVDNGKRMTESCKIVVR